MIAKIIGLSVVIAAFAGGFEHRGSAQEPPADTKAEAAEASAIAKKLAGEFVFQLEKASDKKLKMEPEPILRWTNHLGRRFYGDVYVWTREGRPEVVASVNNVFAARRGTETEILSLSTGRPVLLHDEKVVWEPSGPCVELKPLPSVPKPGPTGAARLLQMRAMAAQFSVVADYGVNKEQKEELRLLRTPIYRYESAAQGVVDGALFAFTKGTDPDALLLVEARGKKVDVEWQFAFARLNGYCALRASLKDKEVWQVDRLSNQTNTDPTQPYFVLRK
jgi:hypothetical protein